MRVDKPTHEPPPAGETTEEQDFRRAFAAAERSVAATPDAEDAFQRATQLVRAADDVVGEAAALRARMARRLMEDEGMTLSQLAERIGTSKSRADQLVRAARTNDSR